MRQVPYIILGSGRLAGHVKHYFDMLSIPHLCWSRRAQNADDLVTLVNRYPQACCLVALSDTALPEWIERLDSISQRPIIHFSASYHHPSAFSVHPLFSFTPQLLTLQSYQSIPMILDQKHTPLSKLLPELNNPSYVIDFKQKAYYHSMCVLSGNLSTFLWQKMIDSCQGLGLPKQAIIPYLKQITNQIETNPQQALTGPIVRADKDTINKHLQALENDPFLLLYQAFIKTYQHTQPKEKHAQPN